MTDVNREREEEVDVEKPVVTDKRRIDPETGKVRQPDTGTAATADPAAEAAAPSGTTGAPEATGGADPLEAARAESLDLADQLARRNADFYNLQQEYNAYVRRSKAEVANYKQAGVHDVVESLLGVLDELAGPSARRPHRALCGDRGEVRGDAAAAIRRRAVRSGRRGVRP
ncbi:hypothetical protein [Georgenia yuyongxinii]